MSEGKRIVVKVGTSTLTGEDGRVDVAYLRDLSLQIARLREDGSSVVLVSSGAIAAGVEALGLPERPTKLTALQAAAAVGQVQIIGTYAELFAESGITVGQVLLTRHDTTHRQQYLYACRTLESLLASGVVPVVNENDTTAVEEIRFGDNDTLAALVGVMVKADLVVLLTDTEGLYDSHPDTEGAELIEHVATLTEDIASAAGGPGSEHASGGMATKIEAARICMKAGVPMVVADGRRPGVVVAAAAGEPVGTYFAGGEGEVAQRKLWIAFARHAAGEITVDQGAAEALRSRGKSLLPAGVVAVDGSFGRGDAVLVRDTEGKTVARGLAGLSSEEIDKVRGSRSDEIDKVAPQLAGREVVHRDKMVIL